MKLFCQLLFPTIETNLQSNRVKLWLKFDFVACATQCIKVNTPSFKNTVSVKHCVLHSGQQENTHTSR